VRKQAVGVGARPLLREQRLEGRHDLAPDGVREARHGVDVPEHAHRHPPGRRASQNLRPGPLEPVQLDANHGLAHWAGGDEEVVVVPPEEPLERLRFSRWVASEGAHGAGDVQAPDRRHTGSNRQVGLLVVDDPPVLLDRRHRRRR
jgi:hypothetical protein